MMFPPKYDPNGRLRARGESVFTKVALEVLRDLGYPLAWVVGFFTALFLALLAVVPMGVLTFVALKEILEYLKPLVQQ